MEDPLLSDDALVEMTLRNSLITREQVRQNEELQPMYNARYLGGHDVRDIYEAQRTKDRALIQALVNALDKCTIDKPDIDGTEFQATALSTAKEQGFTPTEG